MIVVNALLDSTESGFVDLTKFINKGYVYFLIKDQRVVYVGQSQSVGARVATHLKSKSFDRCVAIEVPKDRLFEVESAFIRKINPPLNGNAGTLTLEDDTTIREFGVAVIDHSIHKLTPLKPMNYGNCLYRLNGELKPGYYDDDEYHHTDECDEFHDENDLDRGDFTDEANEKLCKRFGCCSWAVVIDLEDVQYTVDRKYSDIFEMPKSMEDKLNESLPEYLKEQQRQWDALTPEQKSEAMRRIVDSIDFGIAKAVS